MFLYSAIQLFWNLSKNQTTKFLFPKITVMLKKKTLHQGFAIAAYSL